MESLACGKAEKHKEADRCSAQPRTVKKGDAGLDADALDMPQRSRKRSQNSHSGSQYETSRSMRANRKSSKVQENGFGSICRKSFKLLYNFLLRFGYLLPGVSIRHACCCCEASRSKIRVVSVERVRDDDAPSTLRA